MDDESNGRPPSPPLKVLVVDDERDNAEMLSLLFRLDGHDARAAHGGAEALGMVERGDFAPDVVFLDLGLPVIDGYQLARRLREMPGLKRATLVALTGYGFHEDRERTRLAGFDHHVVKPAEYAELHTLLLQAADRKAAGRGRLV